MTIKASLWMISELLFLMKPKYLGYLACIQSFVIHDGWTIDILFLNIVVC